MAVIAERTACDEEPVPTAPVARPARPRRAAGRVPVLVLIALLSAAIAVSAVISLAFGSVPIPVSDVWAVVRAHLFGTQGAEAVADTIVWDIRLPRVLLAACVGAGLALAGTAMQTLVRNPLADPYLLGISSGAGVGATLVIMFGALSGFGIWAISLGALGGALVATVLVFGISLAQGGLTPLRLILTGVVMAAAFSSLSSFLVFLSPRSDGAISVMFWMLGSVAGARWALIVPAFIVVGVAAILMLSVHSWLDALANGPEVAASLGVPVRGLRTGLFVLTSVLVGVIVAVSGGIGFVGLIVPHLARIVVGARHRATLPVAALGGALFLMWVDVASRVLVAPAELPLGVMTGFVGAPIFLFLLGRRHYSFGGGD